LLAILQGLSQNILNVLQAFDSVTHAQAEIAEPFMVESDGPVLGQEFDHIGDDLGLLSTPELVEIVLVQADEGPEGLQDDLLVAHVGDRVDEADGVECELDVVALASGDVQVVTHQVRSILVVFLILLR